MTCLSGYPRYWQEEEAIPPALYPKFPDLSHNWFVSAFFADPQSGRSLGKSLFPLFDFRNEITSTTSKEGCAKSCFDRENHAKVAYKGTNETPLNGI